MPFRTLALAGAVTAAAFVPTAPAMAVTCPPPVVSTACWAYGTVCREVIQGVDRDVHALLCTVAA